MLGRKSSLLRLNPPFILIHVYFYHPSHFPYLPTMSQTDAITGDEEQQQATKGHDNDDCDLESLYEESEEEQRTNNINDYSHNNNTRPEMRLMPTAAHQSHTNETTLGQTDEPAIAVDVDIDDKPRAKERAPKRKQRVETIEASGDGGGDRNGNSNGNINDTGNATAQYSEDGDNGDKNENEVQENEQFSNGGWTPNVGAGVWEWRVEPLPRGSSSGRNSRRQPRKNSRLLERLSTEFRETYTTLSQEMEVLESEYVDIQVQVEAHETMKTSRVLVQVREDLPLLLVFVHRQYAVVNSKKRLVSVAVQYMDDTPSPAHVAARNDIRAYCEKEEWTTDVTSVVRFWIQCVTATGADDSEDGSDDNDDAGADANDNANDNDKNDSANDTDNHHEGI